MSFVLQLPLLNPCLGLFQLDHVFGSLRWMIHVEGLLARFDSHLIVDSFLSHFLHLKCSIDGSDFGDRF